MGLLLFLSELSYLWLTGQLLRALWLPQTSPPHTHTDTDVHRLFFLDPGFLCTTRTPGPVEPCFILGQLSFSSYFFLLAVFSFFFCFVFLSSPPPLLFSSFDCLGFGFWILVWFLDFGLDFGCSHCCFALLLTF